MPTYRELLQERDELLRRVAEQEKRIAFLEKALEELQRKGKRQRLAKAAEPSYETLVENVRGSSVVYPDETGWRIGGRSWWLWAFVTAGQTVYRIARGRGLCGGLGGAGGELFGPDRLGRLGSLPSVCPSHAPDLPGPPAAPLPGNAGDSPGLGRGIPAPGAEPPADGLGSPGPSRRRAD